MLSLDISDTRELPRPPRVLAIVCFDSYSIAYPSGRVHRIIPRGLSRIAR